MGIASRSILFVCTANLFRSPMAEVMFQAVIKQEDGAPDWRIESAGTWTRGGEKCPPEVVGSMARRGLDLSTHRSRPVNAQMLRDFSLILTMEPGQKEALRVEFPDIADRVFLLGELAGAGAAVADPAGGARAEIDRAAADIERYLNHGKGRIIELAVNRASSPLTVI